METIELVLVSQGWFKVTYKINYSSQLRKVLECYCSSYNIDIDGMLLKVDGNVLDLNLRPIDYAFNNGILITVEGPNRPNIQQSNNQDTVQFKINSIYFNIRRTAPLHKCIAAYNKQYNSNLDKLYYNGQIIDPTLSAYDLNLTKDCVLTLS